VPLLSFPSASLPHPNRAEAPKGSALARFRAADAAGRGVGWSLPPGYLKYRGVVRSGLQGVNG